MMHAPSCGLVSPEQKAAALQEALESQTFSRAEQLRNFLRLVCEMESAGRASDINEYMIGVEGLGRSQSFEPSTDGIVRSRAHALRQKLFEYYTKENPTAAVRIELPKGSYVPRFVPKEAAEPVPPPHPVEPEIVVAPPAPARRPSLPSRLRDIAIGCVLAASVLLALDFALHREKGRPGISPVLAEAWGPLARPDANALIVLERADHYLVRALPPGARVNGVVNADVPPEIRTQQERVRPIEPGMDLRLLGVSAYRNGQVLGLAAVLGVLNQAGASTQVLPDRAVPMVNLRSRNALLFGDPNLVDPISRLMRQGVYSIEFEKSLGDFVVRERAGSSGAPKTFAPRTDQGTDEYPGVLTVLPGDDPDGNKRTVIFAGGNSIGSQAAAEYFTSPRSLQELKDRFRRQHLSGFPRAYQVVVMGRSAGPSMLSFTYLAHHVLDKSTQQ